MSHLCLGVGPDQLETPRHGQPSFFLFFGSLFFYGWDEHTRMKGHRVVIMGSTRPGKARNGLTYYSNSISALNSAKTWDAEDEVISHILIHEYSLNANGQVQPLILMLLKSIL